MQAASIAAFGYLVLTAAASIPLFTRPDSPLSGVLVFVLTLPWSVLVGIPLAVWKPGLMSERAEILAVFGAFALINAVLICRIVRRARGSSADRATRDRRHVLDRPRRSREVRISDDRKI